jgi:hypothetical protein
MQEEDLFAHEETPPTTSEHECGGDRNRSDLSAVSPVPQEAPPQAHPPKTERRLTAGHHLRLLLLALVGVMLVVLAGGYSVFRAVSPQPRQVSSKGRMSPVAS